MSKKLKFLAMMLTCILLSINQVMGDSFTMYNGSSINSSWTKSSSRSALVTYASKYSVQLMGPSGGNYGEVWSTITFTGITAISINATGSNNRTLTTYYSANGSSWTALANTTNISQNSSSYSDYNIDITGLPSSAVYIKFRSGGNSIYIRTVTITYSSGKTVYLDATGFSAADSKFGVYSWKNGSDPKVEKMSDAFMTSVTECRSNIYKADIPADHDRVIFLHCNSGSAPAADWSNKDKQTVDLTPSTNDFFTVSGISDGKYTGSWGTYATNVTVSFDKNTTANGVDDPDDQCVAKSSGKATAPTISDMSHGRLGYQLSGWYENAGGTGSAWNFSTGTFSADKTLYAKWTAGATTTVALNPTWSGSGNTWDKADAIIYAHFYIDGTTQAQDVLMTKNVCDGVFTASAPYGATHVSFARCKSGTESLGANWDTDDNIYNYVAGLEIAANYQYSITGWGSGKVGTAKKESSAYTPSTFTISFSAGTGGSGGPMASITSIACDANQTLTANGFTAPTGHTFDAWHANVDVTVSSSTVEAGEDIADGATIQNIRSNIALTAQWKYSVYTITYKDKGGGAFSGSHVNTPSTHPITHTYGTATALNGATKSYNTFGGWYTNSSCTGDPVTSLGATDYTENITLYAKWIPKVDQFIDDLHETTGYTSASPHEETGAYSMPGPLSNGDKTTGNDCRKAHYVFVGWVTAGGQNTNGTIKGSPKIWQPGESNTANNQTYYAVWAEDVE